MYHNALRWPVEPRWTWLSIPPWLPSLLFCLLLGEPGMFSGLAVMQTDAGIAVHRLWTSR